MQVRHVAVMLGRAGLLSSRIVLVDLGLQLHVCLWMGEKGKEDAREAARGGIRTAHDSENAVIDELLQRWRCLFREILFVLQMQMQKSMIINARGRWVDLLDSGTSRTLWSHAASSPGQGSCHA